MQKPFSITIDGESGVGKSTIAGYLAKHYSMHHLNTGAMYRAMALGILNFSVDPLDEKAVLAVLPIIQIDVDFNEDKQNTYLNKQLLGRELYSNQVSNVSGMICRYQPVRDYLVAKQREVAAAYPVVLDGRDCGSVILPSAQIKIYLTANIQARTDRRHTELKEKGVEISREQVMQELLKRDENDKKGKGNLIKMPDTVTVDSSNLNIEQVAHKIVEIIDRKIKSV